MNESDLSHFKTLISLFFIYFLVIFKSYLVMEKLLSDVENLKEMIKFDHFADRTSLIERARYSLHRKYFLSLIICFLQHEHPHPRPKDIVVLKTKKKKCEEDALLYWGHILNKFECSVVWFVLQSEFLWQMRTILQTAYENEKWGINKSLSL